MSSLGASTTPEPTGAPDSHPLLSEPRPLSTVHETQEPSPELNQLLPEQQKDLKALNEILAKSQAEDYHTKYDSTEKRAYTTNGNSLVIQLTGNQTTETLTRISIAFDIV